jgi:hypothetical protein
MKDSPPGRPRCLEDPEADAGLCPMTAGLRFGAAGIAILGILQGCVSGESPAPAGAGRIVVAVYTDVDGASFSTDGNVYARYTDFLDHEECVRLSGGELTSLVAALDRTGFFAETPPGRSGECVFFCDRGLNVPAKYRENFAGLSLSQRPPALARFLTLKAECDN